MTLKSAPVREFLQRAALFVLVGLVLYAGLYAASEQLIDRHGKRNRFYQVKTASSARYGYVILGASHAAAFDYEDMNARLEQLTGTKILNLSIVGGGVVVNRLLLDYFLAEHQTAAVLYVLDSFAFYSKQWNEDRLKDTRLFNRAPFDRALGRLLLKDRETRLVALDYITGFSKINNADRFKPDVSDDEAGRFDRIYRPVRQIDLQRIEYLYPAETRAANPALGHYLAAFEDLIRSVKSRNIRFIAIKPPIPRRIYGLIPNEGQFDMMVRAIADRQGVEFHDFSLVGNDEKFFYDTDHLNRAGVLYFFEHYLKDTLAP